jgi:excisionase family DNA binding protein
MYAKNPDFMHTIASVAKRLNLSQSAVYSLCDSGKLRHYRFGRAYRIKERDLDSYMRKCCVESILQEDSED